MRRAVEGRPRERYVDSQSQPAGRREWMQRRIGTPFRRLRRIVLRGAWRARAIASNDYSDNRRNRPCSKPSSSSQGLRTCEKQGGISCRYLRVSTRNDLQMRDTSRCREDGSTRTVLGSRFGPPVGARSPPGRHQARSSKTSPGCSVSWSSRRGRRPSGPARHRTRLRASGAMRDSTGRGIAASRQGSGDDTRGLSSQCRFDRCRVG
jgi:hypothetical protein